jgi:hypothetical protein
MYSGFDFSGSSSKSGLDPDSTQNGIAREKKFKNQGMR